jgi:hypothetical protein
MRFAVIAIVLLLLAGPAAAQRGSSPMPPNPTDNNGEPAPPSPPRVFGSANCSPHFQCSDASSMGASGLASNADKCIASFFGYSSPDSFFDTSGLDSNNCLTAKPNVIPKGMGAQLSPRCCIAVQNDGACAFHCDLVTAN